MPTKADPNELVSVIFHASDGTKHKVNIPRHMTSNASQKAVERWLVADGQLGSPSAPELPPSVEDVVDQVRAEQVAADFSVVEQLRAQLDELQGRLDGQPLSHAELVAARQEITDFMLKAADAGAQLVVVEGAGSRIRSELQAIATPLQEQAAETARQQQENNEVQARVLDDLQAQAAALLEALSQDAAAAAVERDAEAIKAAKATAKTTAREVALDRLKDMWGPGVTVCPESPADTDKESFSQRWWGRSQVEGDGCLQVSDDGITVWRYAGGEWLESSRLEPQQRLINQSIAVEDRSSNVVGTTFTNGGNNSGGGATKPLVNAIPAGSGSTLVFESLEAARRGVVSRAFTCQLLFIVTSGPLTGQSVTLLVSGLLQGASNTAICEYSEVESAGGLAGMCNPTFNAQLGSATDATVRTQTLQVFVGGLNGTAFDGAAIQGWALFTEPQR